MTDNRKFAPVMTAARRTDDGADRASQVQVRDEMDRLEKAGIVFREQVERLMERLVPVVIPGPKPDEAEVTLQARECLCPLAGRIRDEARRVEEGNALLCRLTNLLAI
jgi:hypothetical protein